jgi:mono/diheme cytochrome c family protein
MVADPRRQAGPRGQPAFFWDSVATRGSHDHMEVIMQFFRFVRQSPVRTLRRSVRRETVWIAGAVFPAFLALSLLPIVRAAQDVTAKPQDDAASRKIRIEEGEKTFRQYCISCHNKAVGDTAPFGPPNLHGIFRGKSAITTAEATTVIVKGKSSMPGWGNVLTRSDISNVIAYLRTQ